MNISYDHYKIFFYVAKYGGISRAANALLQAQPNISKTVKKLEKELGCKLLVRGVRGVSLTPEGEKLYRHLQIAFEHINAAEAEMILEGNLESGTVSIATTEMAFYCSLLPAISRFSKDYPGVKIKVANLNNDGALSMLKKGLADFALLSCKNISDNIFRTKKILEFREMLCAKKGYASTLDFKISDIDQYTYIALDKSTYSSRLYKDYFLSQEIIREPDIEAATVSQVLGFIKSGMGIGFIPEPMIKDLIEGGELEELVLSDPPKQRSIYLAEDKGAPLSTAAKKLTEYLLNI